MPKVERKGIIMSTALKDTFWNRMDDVQAGLLSAAGERPIPMAPHADADEGAIWFIAAAGSAAERAAKGATRPPSSWRIPRPIFTPRSTAHSLR